MIKQYAYLSMACLVLSSFGAWATPLVVVDKGSPVQYIEALGDLPNSGNPTGWTSADYDLGQDQGKGDKGNGDHSGNWQNGVFGVGYGDDDDNTLITPDNNVHSVYLRAAFTLEDAGKIRAMLLRLDYDDGYIAWLNGTEISRSTSMAGKTAAWNTESGRHETIGALGVPIDLSKYVSLLVNGKNVLAIGVWNQKPDSSDLTLLPRLTLYDAPYLPEPLHVYLTWQGDTSTTMTVNYQTGVPAGKSEVSYDTESHGGDPSAYKFHATGSAHEVAGLNAYVEREVHWVPLTHLSPGQTYYFVAGDPATGVSTEMKFQTIPSGDAAIRFTVGGDMDTIPAVAKLHRQAARQSPMFGLLTGDLAVCNGKLENWERWDAWLNLWQDNMVTPDGCVIPMVVGMGNHETNGSFGQTWEKAPFYFGYFAQGPEAYPPPQPAIHFSRHFGQNVLLCVLNSGHVEPVEGAQTEWLSHELAAASSIPYRFAAYHVPVYPSHRPLTDKNIAAVRTYWRPVFDEYGLTTAFEGHDHTEKRTKLLKGDKLDPNGTLYLGDGYGTQGLRPGDQKDQWYMAHLESKYHLWLVEVPGTQTPGAAPVYTAIDQDGNIIDQYSKSADNAAAGTK